MTNLDDLFSGGSGSNNKLTAHCFSGKLAPEKIKSTVRVARYVFRFDKPFSVWNSAQLKALIDNGFFIENKERIKNHYSEFYKKYSKEIGLTK